MFDFGTILVYVVAYFGLFTGIFFILTLIENKDNLSNPKPRYFSKVSVVVPAYNEEKTIAKTIRSLLNLDYPKDRLQIMIVDDGSTDNTYKVAKGFRKYGVEVFTKENEGKAAALNLALKKSKGEFFGALDADSFVDKKALKKIIGHFQDKNIMAVTPSLKVYEPKTFLQKIQYTEYLMGIFLRKIFAFLGSIHVTPGPFTIYRKSFFQKYGGYDEYNLTEDIEIALRIQTKGYEIENSVDASVYTVSPAKFLPLLKQRIRWYTGFTENVIRYKELFNPVKYGNLGAFILPGSFISVGLVIITLFYASYKFITRILIQNFINLRAIGFDLSRFFHFKPDIFYVNLSSKLFISILTIMIGITTIYIAKKLSKEKTKIKFFYIAYMLVYWMLFGFWWLIAGAYTVLGKKVEWGQRKDYVKKAVV
ncbi:glycosyltransferase family 2 protein [Candidatus Woesearchaeota archaeon]|nr:glycosyltransferase family 2 protein [Candidatus Woesearchaeota archaeon]